MFMAHVKFIREFPGVPRLVFAELQQPDSSPVRQRVQQIMRRYRQMLAEILGKAKAARLIGSDVDVQAAAALFLGAIQGLVMQSMLGGVSPDAEESVLGVVRLTPCQPGSQIMKPSQFISRRLGLGLFAAILVVGFGVVVARSGPLSSIQVTTLRVESGSLSPAIFGIGTVEARRSYLIGPTAAGRVKAVHADVGETVKAGQLLAEIDPVRPGRAPSFNGSSLCPGCQCRHRCRSTTQGCLARRQLAEINAKRYRDLGGKNFVSPSAVEGKQQELDLGSGST